MTDEEDVANQGATDSKFEDIHVPGLGVRGALADDDAENSGLENSRICSWARDACARRVEFVKQRTTRTLEGFRRVGSRHTVKLATLTSDWKAAVTGGRRRAALLVNAAGTRLWKMRVLLASGAQIMVLVLRSTARDKLRPSVATSLREVRSQFLRSSQAANARIERVRKDIWPRILIEASRRSRRAHSFLASTATGVRSRARAITACRVDLRLSRNFQLNRSALRRSLPALAVLLVIATFVLQVTVAAVRR